MGRKGERSILVLALIQGLDLAQGPAPLKSRRRSRGQGAGLSPAHAPSPSETQNPGLVPSHAEKRGHQADLRARTEERKGARRRSQEWILNLGLVHPQRTETK